MNLATTNVFDSYWHFAAERQAVYYRRLIDPVGPWTFDPIIRNHRFTNAYRALDRVSQYLIKEVQYGAGRSQNPEEIFFRTMLFKIFNRIETWRSLEERLGPLSWTETSLASIDSILNDIFSNNDRIYSAAYIMPSPILGRSRKHSNHLLLLKKMMADRAASTIASCNSLEEVYKTILSYPGIGPFLAFQYTIDLNYSNLIDFDERSFVVAGPGALDGISKCFKGGERLNPVQVINFIADQQDAEFEKRGLVFLGLFGRPLQPIDCQNIFCEISKYARVAHPEVAGVSGRTRIKQKYRTPKSSVEKPFFPPKWKIAVDRDLVPPLCRPQRDLFT